VTERANFPLLPYSYIVEQYDLRWLLEVAYVMPSSLGGLLVSGERGTAKSTIVRSFATMMNGMLPVTLPINATDDRVMGGWEIEALMRGDLEWQPGLLEQAGEAGMLYIDEVNLLDDHIINLILDVASTNVLVVEREGMGRAQAEVSFALVGTMNPEEGALRPQLLDRFGLAVRMTAERSPAVRREILRTVLRFDAERVLDDSVWLAAGERGDAERKAALEAAKAAFAGVELTDQAEELCAEVAHAFNVVGHRAEIVMAQGACAAAALARRSVTTPEDVRRIAPHAVMHRRRDVAYSDGFEWLPKDDERLARVIPEA
jgi:magnesium chelatase subunit I